VKHRPGTQTRVTLSLAIGLIAATVATGPAAAQQQEPPAQAQQREHVVKRGDTLWDLAQFYLNNPFLWPSIFEINRSVVEDPHWIYPNERLTIPVLEMVTAAPADATAVAEPPMTFGPAATPTVRTRFYREPSPVVDTMVVQYLQVDQIVVPYAVTPHEYRAAPWVQDPDGLAVLGRIYGLTDPAAADDKLAVAVRPYDRIYIANLSGSRPSVGDTIMAVRVGHGVDGLGSIVQPLALLHIETVALEALVAKVVHQYAPARAGDVVIAAEPVPALRRGEPSDVGAGATGRIVDFLEDQAIYIASDQAFLDIGRVDGVGVGDELVAYYPERRIESGGPLLPQEPVATLRVVKVRDNTSTVRVVELNTSALVPGLPVRVVRRMQ